MDTQNQPANKEYSTRDIYLAASLMTLKFSMVSIDYQIEGERRLPVGYFNFQDTPELQETIRNYWQGKVLIEPRSFMTSLQGLKAQVTQAYKSPRNAF